MADEIAPQSSSAPPDAGAPPPASRPPRWDPAFGWLVLVYVLIAIFLPIAAIVVLHLPTSIKQFNVRTVLPIEFTNAFCVFLAMVVVGRIGKRSLGDFGLPLRQAFGLLFWEGAAWGFLMLSAVVFVLQARGHMQITATTMTHHDVLKYAVLWGAVFLCVGMYEETFFRGFFLFAISRRLTFWPAALILSVAFAAAHLGNPGENPFGIVQVFVVGMLYCLVVRRTGSLWFAIGNHMAWDWAQTYFYGTPDSGLVGVGHYLNSAVQGPGWLTGGSAGPEGSVLAFLVLLLAAALVHFRFPKATYPDRPA